MTTEEIKQRLKEIQIEVNNTPRPKPKQHSVEDWDNIAQSLLEWHWWRDEIEEEYKSLCLLIGKKPKKILFRY